MEIDRPEGYTMQDGCWDCRHANRSFTSGYKCLLAVLPQVTLPKSAGGPLDTRAAMVIVDAVYQQIEDAANDAPSVDKVGMCPAWGAKPDA